MATFKERVTLLLGNEDISTHGISDGELTDLLQSGVRDIINRLTIINPQLLQLFGKTTNIGAGAVAEINGQILSVVGTEGTSNRPATEIPYSQSFMVENGDSLFYQSKYNPVYYRTGNDVAILPSGGTVIHVDASPSIAHGDTSSANVPDQYNELIAMYAAIQCYWAILKTMEDSYSSYVSPATLQAPSLSASLPTDLVVPNFPYIPNEIKSLYEGTPGIVRTSIDTSIPTYTPPTMDAVSLASLADITIPDPPSKPAVADTVLSFSGTAPTYSQQALSLPDFPTITDFALTGTAANPPSAPIAPNLTAETVSDHSIPALPAPPMYSSPKVLGVVEELMAVAPSVSNADTLSATYAGATDMQEIIEAAWAYIQEEEDPEMTGLAHAHIGQIISLYSTQMNDNMNEFNARVQEYQQEVQKTMQQATMDRSKKDKQTDMNWQQQQVQYQQELAKHGAEIALYQADISQQVQEWQLQNMTYKMAKWNSEVGHAIQEHSANMQNSLNKFNEENAKYQMDWQEAVQNAQLDSGNTANELSIYDKDLSRYQAEVNSIIQKYTQNELLKKWEVYKFDYSQALAKHQADMTNNMNTFNSDNTKLQLELQIAQNNANQVHSALMQKMQVDTELEKNNSAQQFQSDVTKFTQDLANYQAVLGRYTSEINTKNTEYQSYLSKYGQDLTDAMNTFNSEFQLKSKKYEQILIRKQQLESQYNTAIGLMAQPKGDT